ncbi:hypothetical protein GCM10022291_15580 [Postechiella marina]|uniref:Uncharacterized protein n=1 Tax=Postechiella marina TaxID=943941 RepID=A0ABP8C7F1_9FLAO
MSLINWQYFPKSHKTPSHLNEVVNAFKVNEKQINSSENYKKSDEVLSCLCPSLEYIGFKVEKSKKKIDKINVPVLFGLNGKLEKYFDADGYNENTKTVIEVEAGRGVLNYQFLKDLFQACMMSDVEYLVIAVRNIYKNNKDFTSVTTFFDTLYTSERLKLPLNGVLIIGY